jgi:hypothetical protein
VRAWLDRLSTPALVWTFTAYSWIATTVCAAWFVRHGAVAGGQEAGVGGSLLWQGAVFGLWLPAGALCWLLIRQLGVGGRTLLAMTLAMAAVVPLEALGGTAVDVAFGSLAWPDWPARVLGRVPTAILLWTAICAVGLAAAQRSQAVEARGRATRLEAALVEARRATSAETEERLMVMVGSRRAPVRLDEIEWLAAAGNYVEVHWGEREGLVREPLKTLESRLDSRVFARSHRSTLVNLARVAETQSLSDGSWRLTMASGAELVASRTYRDALLSRLGR